MATITLTIPNGAMTRVVDALCDRGGWTAESGLTKPQFAKAHVIDYVRTVTRHYEGEREGKRAKDAALAAADNEITIT